MLSAPSAFARSGKSASPKTPAPKTNKKHVKTGQNRRSPRHSAGNNVPSK